QISGTVRGDSQRSLNNAMVVLVPDQRDRHDLYRFIIRTPNGSFTFPSVAPGSYKIFAWEDIEQFSWFDPKVLPQYETHAVASNSSGANLTLDLRVISAAGAR